MEEEQSIENALNKVKDLMVSPKKPLDDNEILELTEDDLFDELDEDYQCESLENDINKQKNPPINENLTKDTHTHINKDNLISEESAAKSAATIKKLIQKMEQPLNDSTKIIKNSTLEEITAEALKPLLKDWLDQHLPEIVQKIVEKEVKNLIPNKDAE